jgi:hypothetical protein
MLDSASDFVFHTQIPSQSLLESQFAVRQFPTGRFWILTEPPPLLPEAAPPLPRRGLPPENEST